MNEPSHQHEPNRTGKHGSGASASRASRVLIADDEANHRKSVSGILARVATELAVADDGEQAVAMVANSMTEGRPFDVVLMDLQMPKLDGYDAASEMRSWGFDGAIIAYSGQSSEEVEERCLRSGFDRFVQKPYSPAELIRIVQDHCCQRHSQARERSIDETAYQIHDHGHYAVVRLHEQASWSDDLKAELRQDLLSLLDEKSCRAVFFDLTDIVLVCSQMMALFLMCHRLNMRVRLCNPGEQAREALEAMKLDSFFVVS